MAKKKSKASKPISKPVKKPLQKGSKGRSEDRAIVKKPAVKLPKRNAADDEKISKLRHYIRTAGLKYLDDANITSIGIGRKVTGGKQTNELCLQFTVKSKPEDKGSLPEGVETSRIPEKLMIDGMEISTDILQREYWPSVRIFDALSTLESVSDRKKRMDPTMPGVSVSHPSGTAGTLGLVVYDSQTGDPCMLSNWHVLHTELGDIGDSVVQPGPFDDNAIENNRCGVLLRSHLGPAGDCAVARIEGREFKTDIFELNVTPNTIGVVDLDDRVIKSGRTTGVTKGIVRRIEVMANITYDGMGQVSIGGFEIGPLPGAPASFEISQGGDSGSAWLLADENGKATEIFVGLHFAGEGAGNPDEHALACYASSVVKKLGISITPVTDPESVASRGYNANFLAERVPLPGFVGDVLGDAFKLDGKPILDYTHFSVCQSESRRLPRLVAWNIDGDRMKQISRRGIRFVRDPRVPAAFQVGDELYAGNPLDRGHVARRADLTWGSLTEARKANKDSFFFTNITPQHEAFNQSEKSGMWGRLENAILEDVEVEGLRVSVMAGPIFRDHDRVYRSVQIPKDFWKLVAYQDSQDDTFKVRAYILTQRDLVSDLEALELDEFRLFQVSLEFLSDETSLDFSNLSAFDVAGRGPQSESLTRFVREVRSAEDLTR